MRHVHAFDTATRLGYPSDPDPEHAMAQATREDILIKLDQIDTALEAPDADKAAILREADAWRTAHPAREDADTLYFVDRLQAIRARHGA